MQTLLIGVLFIFSLLYIQSEIEAASAPVGRIINGRIAAPKQFPYQVSIKPFIQSAWIHLCGGTIISRKIVLTAANCVTRTRFTVARLHFGAVDKYNTSETGHVQMTVGVGNFIVHEDWTGKIWRNDIALIRLPKELVYNDYIRPARLPDSGDSYTNEKAVASGWGVTQVLSNGLNPTSTTLLYYETSIMSNIRCVIYKPVFLSQLCSEPGKGSVCDLDFGGPLTTRNVDGTYSLVGIASFVSSPKCPTRMPSFFTRVSSYLEWIRTHAGAGNLV